MNVCVPLPELGPVPGLHPWRWRLIGRHPAGAARSWLDAVAPVVHQWRYVIDSGADVELSVTLPARRRYLSDRRRRAAIHWGRGIVLTACAAYRVLPARIIVSITYDTDTVARWCDAALYVRKETP